MTDVVDTAARIRAEAVALFTTQGYASGSLREIADRVGITKASLYYHYASKQDLLLAVLDPLIAEWRSVVEAAELLPHDRDAVRTVLEVTLDMMLRHRAVAGLLIRDAAGVVAALEPVVDDLVALSRRMERWLAGPAPTAAGRVHAAAAMQVLGTALRSGATLTDVPQAQVRASLLAAAQLVLDPP
jgi:AcrR family transcriptional regulator